MHEDNVRDFPKLDSEINACFLLNERGDLYFLLHKFGEQIILFNLRIGKNCSEGKKDIANYCTKPIRQDANYDLENNDSRNILSQYRLESCDLL